MNRSTLLSLPSVAVALLCFPPGLAVAQEPDVPYRLPPVEQGLPMARPLLVDWDGSIELGLNGAEGNAQSFSIRAGGDLKRETETSIWDLDLVYAKTTSGSVLSQHNASLNTKYELLHDSPWTAFIRFGAVYDEFKAFDYRLVLNSGGAYRLIETDLTKLKLRAGAGVSREFGGPNNDYVPESLFGLDFERKLGERQKLTAVVDYFPDWRDYGDYRLVTKVGWLLQLDEAGRLSLKFSIIDRYDSTPEGRQPNDFDYAALLLYKL